MIETSDLQVTAKWKNLYNRPRMLVDDFLALWLVEVWCAHTSPKDLPHIPLTNTGMFVMSWATNGYLGS